MSFLPNHDTSINQPEQQRHYKEKKTCMLLLMGIYDEVFVFLE